MRLQGNALGGMLRDLDRRTRTTTRRRGSGRPQVPDPVPAEPPRVKVRREEADVVVTDAEGRARWVFRRPFPVVPVLTAVAVDPDPESGQTVVVALEAVDEQGATVRVWATRPLRGTGVAEPAGMGVQVHVTARPGPR